MTLIDTAKAPERRHRRRQRVWLRAELRTGDRTLTACRVLDLGATSAQVRLDGPCLLPGTLQLVIPEVGATREAAILWRRGGLVGLTLSGD